MIPSDKEAIFLSLIKKSISLFAGTVAFFV